MTALLLLLLAQDALAAAGAAAMQAKNYPEAVHAYRALLVKEPANTNWRLQLGLAHFYGNEHSEAASQLADFIRRQPQPGAGHLFLGVSLLKLQRPCDAIAPLEAALRWPQRPRSRWIELAEAYQGCQRWEPAAQAYAEAAQADPKDLRIVRRGAHCWRLARRYPAAKALFATLEIHYASNAEFQFEYGDTLMRLDGAAAGLPWLEKAAAADPALMPAQAALGRALLELDRPAAAVPHLEAAAKTDPALLLALSRAYRSVGRPLEATRAEAGYKKHFAKGY